MAENHPYHSFLNGRTDGQALLALEEVIKSGLSPETLEGAHVRIFTGTAKTLKERLGYIRFNGVSLMQAHRLTEFPYFDEDGKVAFYRYRLSPTAYKKEDNTPVKYLHPKDTLATPYILPSVWDLRDKVNKPLWITEGEKKCLKLLQHGRPTIALSGVWNFRAGKESQETESTYLWKEFSVFQWKGRTVYLGFDADLWVNPMVRRPLYELAFKLYGRGAVVRFALWQGKKGIDDFLAVHEDPEGMLSDIEHEAKNLENFICQDHHREILDALYRAAQGIHGTVYKTLIGVIAPKLKLKERDVVTDITRRRQAQVRASVDNSLHPYFIDDQGAVNRWRRDRDGSEVSQKLANFTARIVEDIFEDNGQETSRRFALIGGTKDREFPKMRIPAPQFATLNWIVTHWGNEAIIEPGQLTKDYLRHFIQEYSRSQGVEQRTVYTHTGWREVNGQWQYLMANGALDDTSIDVELPGEFLEMGRYCLPHKAHKEVEAIQTSLSFLHMGKVEITYPSYAYTFLSPLTGILDPIPNFSAYFYGETGSFKSTVATLLLSHFGNFAISNLSNFDSTPNQIEKRAFVLKDTLYILDDYHPSARHKEASAKEAIAQRLIRACSNRTGRERLNPDATEKGKYVPRGMLLITGEELVELQSTLARVMVVEFNYGDIDMERMTELQRPEQRGILPHAMSSYILWVKENLSRIKATFPGRFEELRAESGIQNGHRKMNEQRAYLLFTFDLLLKWALEKGAITENDAAIALERGKEAFFAITHRQAERIDQDDPVKLFFGIIDSLLTQGKVRLDNKESGYSDCRGGDSGELIGYYDPYFYYLLPQVVWHVVLTYLRLEGGHFPFSRNTLYAVLEKRGYIESRDGKHTTPAKIHGIVKRVLKMRRGNNDPLPSATGISNDE